MNMKGKTEMTQFLIKLDVQKFAQRSLSKRTVCDLGSLSCVLSWCYTYLFWSPPVAKPIKDNCLTKWYMETK